MPAGVLRRRLLKQRLSVSLRFHDSAAATDDGMLLLDAEHGREREEVKFKTLITFLMKIWAHAIERDCAWISKVYSGLFSVFRKKNIVLEMHLIHSCLSFATGCQNKHAEKKIISKIEILTPNTESPPTPS